MTLEQPQKLTVVPHQDFIDFEVWDDTLHITQEDHGCGGQSITIIGKSNLELVIAALQKVSEGWE